MKIKIRKGMFPLVADGEYTGKHLYLDDGDDVSYFYWDATLVVPGFATLKMNNQEFTIGITRADYVAFKDDPNWWKGWTAT